MLENVLKKLITFQTVTGNFKELDKTYTWIKNELKDLGLYFREFTSNGYVSLLITTKKTKKPKLWLVAHIDVVPGSKNVFKPIVKNGHIYGRGSFDMKYAIAVYMQLFKKLGKDLKNYDIGIMLVSDEEIGGTNGVGKLLDSGFVSKYAFLPDGGNNLTLERSAKGTVTYELTSVGRSAHASRTWEGDNAIEKLIDLIQDIKKEFISEPCNTSNHQHNTINVGKIDGGVAANSIADSASALINIRFTSKYNLESIRALLKKKIKNYKGITLTEGMSGNSSRYDYQNTFGKCFLSVLKKHISTVKFIDSHGTSDGRYFASKNIPTILTRPKGGGHHSEEEWVNITSLDKFYKILEEFVKTFPDI